MTFFLALSSRHEVKARFELFLVAYLLFRLLVEFLKPTPALSGLGLTAIQWACVGG